MKSVRTLAAIAGLTFSLTACLESTMDQAPGRKDLGSGSGGATNQGTWDLRLTFPGEGTYEGVSNLPTSAQLCSTGTGGQNVAGIIGTAICQTGTPTDAGAAAHVLSGKQFWDASGALITGSMTNRGTWDLTTAFPGIGYYSAVSNAPSATDIRSGATVLGVAGNSNVVNTSTGDAIAGEILSGKKAWVDGVEITGTVTTSAPTQAAVASGSENNDAVTSVTVNPSAGSLFSGFTVNLGAHFTRDNICTGKTIFGRLGTAACQHLTDYAFHDVGSSTTRLIPKMTDTTYTTEINHDALTVCGTTQNTVEARIAHCASVNGSNATWDGSALGKTNYSTWKLVTKTASGGQGREVWRDERTKLIWGDYVGNYDVWSPNSWSVRDGESRSYFNWCMASGNTESSGGLNCNIGQPGSRNYPGVSLCAESPGLLTPAGVHNTDSPAYWVTSWVSTGTAVIDSKGGMLATATGTAPSVKWRLPLKEDFYVALANGGIRVLPRMASFGGYLTAAFPGDWKLDHIYFNSWSTYEVSSGYNYYDGYNNTSYAVVRCVGRE